MCFHRKSDSPDVLEKSYRWIEWLPDAPHTPHTEIWVRWKISDQRNVWFYCVMRPFSRSWVSLAQRLFFWEKEWCTVNGLSFASPLIIYLSTLSCFLYKKKVSSLNLASEERVYFWISFRPSCQWMWMSVEKGLGSVSGWGFLFPRSTPEHPGSMVVKAVHPWSDYLSHRWIPGVIRNIQEYPVDPSQSLSFLELKRKTSIWVLLRT